MAYVPRLKDKYKQEVVPALSKKFNYKSSMQVPRLLKICVNQGVGDAVSDKKLIDSAIQEMTMITGQKPVPTKSASSTAQAVSGATQSKKTAT